MTKIKNGDMDNKGEVAMVFGKQVSSGRSSKEEVEMTRPAY